MMKKICFMIPVHENKEVIKDLLENVNYFCPNSSIVLYQSGDDPKLCEGLGYPICPTSKSLVYGSGLVWFHLDVMEWLEDIDFTYDYLINLDSDALFAKEGFEAFILSEMNGFDYMATHKRYPEADWYPGRFIKHAWSTWQHVFTLDYFMACFNNGQTFSKKFVQQIINYPKLNELKAAIQNTETFAVEEIIFPTLAEVLGVESKSYPNDVQDWIRYRPYFIKEEISRGIKNNANCYLLHPVHRNMEDPARSYIRSLKG